MFTKETMSLLLRHSSRYTSFGYARCIEPISKRLFSALPPHTLLQMPKLSPTMEHGNLAKWRKKQGESVAPGEIIADVETDKATVEFEAQDNFHIAKLLVAEGAKEVKVGDVIAITVEDPGSISAFADFVLEKAAAAPPKAEAPAAATAPAAAAPPPPSAPAAAQTAITAIPAGFTASSAAGTVLASPYAKFLAKQQGKNLVGAAGSYPGGFIIAADLDKISAGAGARAGVAGPLATAMSSKEIEEARTLYALEMQRSKQTVPHYYLKAECEVDGVLSALKSKDIDLADIIMKAAAAASVKVPALNSMWMGETIRHFDRVDINFIIETPDRLTLQPLIRGVESKGLSIIAKERLAAMENAEKKLLSPDQQALGTMSVSLLDDVLDSSAVIRPPQSAILTVGSMKKVVKMSKDAQLQKQMGADGSMSYLLDKKDVKIATVVHATLSCDHRVVDGAVGAAWMAAFKGHLEDPINMLR